MKTEKLKQLANSPTLTFGILFLPMAIFAGVIIFSTAINYFQINQAKISLIKLNEIHPVLSASVSNVPVFTSRDVSNVIESDINSISNALKIEENVALLGVFVTISTIALPFIVYFNLRQEKTELLSRFMDEKKELLARISELDARIYKFSEEKEELINEVHREELTLEKTLQDYLENAKQHINDTERVIDDKINSVKDQVKQFSEEKISLGIQMNTFKRNKIVSNIYATKSLYISDKYNKSNFDDIIMTAQTLELKLFKLMSDKNRDIENSFAWLKQSINYRDIYNRLDYIHQLYTTITIMQSSGYFIANAVQKTLYDDFLTYLGNQTPD